MVEIKDNNWIARDVPWNLPVQVLGGAKLIKPNKDMGFMDCATPMCYNFILQLTSKHEGCYDNNHLLWYSH